MIVIAIIIIHTLLPREKFGEFGADKFAMKNPNPVSGKFAAGEFTAESKVRSRKFGA